MSPKLLVIASSLDLHRRRATGTSHSTPVYALTNLHAASLPTCLLKRLSAVGSPRANNYFGRHCVWWEFWGLLLSQLSTFSFLHILYATIASIKYRYKFVSIKFILKGLSAELKSLRLSVAYNLRSMRFHALRLSVAYNFRSMRY